MQKTDDLQEVNLITGYEWTEIYLIEELIERNYLPEGDRADLIRLVKKEDQIQVLYAHYSEGELTQIVNSYLNELESKRICIAFSNN